MGVLIDTSILIAGGKAKLSPGDLTAARRSEECFISAITVSELLVGVHRAADAAIRMRRSVHVEALLDHFAVVPIDLPIARLHTQLWAELAALRTPIGPHDLWLAASAITHGFSISYAERSRVRARTWTRRRTMWAMNPYSRRARHSIWQTPVLS